MADIKVNDLQINDIKPVGFELMDDSENFLSDLNDSELDIVGGLQAASGCGSGFLCCITRAE
jgi:hypothetical protein